jgi:hypothetical protein
MIVHFISSKSDIKNNYEHLKRIVDTIKSSGHELAREWLDLEYEYASSGKKHSAIDWRKVNQENLEALSRADVVIAEATIKSFSTGFQVATAIQQKKPTLILTRDNALEGTFASGLTSDFVNAKNYTPENLNDIISAFIIQNTIETKDLRFNFFIDRQIYNYLRWASYKTGKNKSEILRDLVLREIEKSDD